MAFDLFALTPADADPGEIADRVGRNLAPYVGAADWLAIHLVDAYAHDEREAPPEAIATLTLAAMLALLDRLDAFALAMADTVKGATSGGLLGLLTGGRK